MLHYCYCYYIIVRANYCGYWSWRCIIIIRWPDGGMLKHISHKKLKIKIQRKFVTVNAHRTIKKESPGITTNVDWKDYKEYNNVNRGKGKWLVNNHAHQTQHFIKKIFKLIWLVWAMKHIFLLLQRWGFLIYQFILPALQVFKQIGQKIQINL